MGGARRWGVLGTARITTAFLRGLRRSDAGEAIRVASRDVERAARFAKANGIPETADSYEALIGADDLDFVYVPLPNSLHGDWTVRALEAGKHVLCEKPLALSRDEAVRIGEAAARAGRHVAEGFMYRHHPQWTALRDRIERGDLGEVVSIDSWFTFPLDPSEETPGSAALGGGALRDVGCYCVHLSRTIAGAEPVSVTAMSRGDEVDRTMVGTMQMAGGVIARFEASIEQDERRGARISGTRRTAIVERPWLPGDEPAVIRIERDGVVEDRIIVPAADCHALQVEDFVRTAEGLEPPRWPIADAIHNAAVIDALFQSAREGRAGVRLG